MIFLVDLPAPVHGMSNVNLAMTQLAKCAGLKPKIINTVPSYLSSIYPGIIWNSVKALHTFYCYIYLIISLLLSRRNTVYRPINGGIGQIYDLIYILISHLFGAKLYIHHHSFRYLNNKSRLFIILNKFAGHSATHIVLGEKMADLLQSLYGIERSQIKTISNLAFLESKKTRYSGISETLQLGHLANLSTEKGVGLFIDICDLLAGLNVNFAAKIAGPFTNKRTEKLVLDALKKNPQIQYIGPLYGDKKHSFYAALDCFIFPSKYKNEAEPLVLYEAAMHGVFLIGTQCGCMQEVIGRLGGYSVNDNDHTAENLADAIQREFRNNELVNRRKLKRVDKFWHQKAYSEETAISLMDEMKNYDLPKTH